MYKLFCLLLIISSTYSTNVLAQDKFEKESRIKRRDVPLKAVTFIDSLSLDVKIKWYREESLTTKSIEAKFKHNTTKYSIEFDTLGNIEDIEFEVKWPDIKVDISDSIIRQLKTDCLQYKIVKVQKQFAGSGNDLFSLLRNDIDSKTLELKYEIVVACNQQKAVNLFEYLFNEKGAIVSKSKIVLKNSSHLEY